MRTDFESSLEKVNVVSQDIGRVVLNLLSNAFFAVTEMKKGNPKDYEPTVWLNTKKISDRIEICVKDNGIGIPKTNHDKIFQPFFTTKPNGQGTVLGLNLSYDIVKAQGGKFKSKPKKMRERNLLFNCKFLKSS